MNEREKGFCWKEEVGKRENSSGVRGSHINFYNDALCKSTDILKYTKQSLCADGSVLIFDLWTQK